MPTNKSFRIISLLPSATEIVCALGLADSLVGISHECDFPCGISDGRAVVTSSILSELKTVDAETDETIEPSALEIDTIVRKALADGESLYRIDIDLLKTLQPDLLLTQGLCDVCAVSHREVVKAANAVAANATVLDLAPVDLETVLETIRLVGDATGTSDRADELCIKMQARWDAVQRKAESATETPRTLILGWSDPPFSAGHWNPELLRLANGIGADWDTVGTPSRTLIAQEIVDFAPEMLVLMACGMDAERANDEAYMLSEMEGWFGLPCVRNGECYTVDGSAFFNRPGPRLAESAEILATILHPELFTEMLPPFSVRRFDTEILDPDSDDDSEDEETTDADD